MKTHNTISGSREGSALFVVMMVILGISAGLAIVAAGSMQRIYSARKLADRIRALAIAEAGAHEAYSILVTNFAARLDTNAFPAVAYGGGNYDVTVTPVSNIAAVILSEGTYGSASESVMLDVKNFGSGAINAWSIDSNLFDYAMLCGGSFTFRGCGDITSTNGTVKLHSNGKMDVRGSANTDVSLSSSTEIKIGNNKTIDGDVTAPVLSYNSSKVNITGTPATQPVPFVTIPDIDLTPFYNYADDNNEVVSGFTMSGGTYTPVGGILWVDGDVVISSHSVFNGSIIATGDIKIAGSADVIPTTCAFGVATRDGDIENQSTGTIEGLIYAKNGNLTYTANGNIEGQVIVKGDIDKGGNSDAILFDQSIPTDPNGDPGAEAQDIIGVTAWQK